MKKALILAIAASLGSPSLGAPTHAPSTAEKTKIYLERGGAEGRGPYYQIGPKLLNSEELAKKLKTEGHKAGKGDLIWVVLYIDETGGIDKVVVPKGQDKKLSTVAVKVARTLKFLPARDKNGPVASKETLSLDFTP